jgi:hypothetical protein
VKYWRAALICILYIERMSVNFLVTVKEADKCLEQRNFEMAAKLYRQALDIDFVMGLDSWRFYYTACVDYGTALKDMK